MSDLDSAGTVAVVGPHPPFRGGIAHFTERLSRTMRHAGRDVMAASFTRLYPELLFPGRSQYERVVEQAVIPQRLIDSINPLGWKRAADRIIESAPSGAVVMYWMPFLAPSLAAVSKRLKKRGVHVLGLVHNALPHERHIGDRYLSRLFLRSCTSILVLSDAVADDVRSLVPEAVVHQLAHPDYDQFGEPVDKTEARRRLDIDRDATMLLFFGLVRAYKGLRVLIEALPDILSEYPETVLVVAGEFYEKIGSYREEIERLGLGRHVRLEDRYIPTGEVKNYFSAADLLVQPYTAATQSGVIPIARNFFVPVVATDTGGLKGALGPMDATAQPGDAASLAAAVCRLLGRSRTAGPSRTQPAGTAPGEKADEPHSWQAFTDAVLEFLDPKP